MVATDEAAYFQRIVARYGRWGSGGRVVSLQEGFAVDNVITSRELSGRVKGESAVLDALLLSKASARTGDGRALPRGARTLMNQHLPPHTPAPPAA